MRTAAALTSVSRRIAGRARFVALASGVTLVFLLPGGLRAGLIPGGGNSRSQCFVEFDVQDVTEPSNHVVCTDGDPCDTDGQCDGVCTFGVSVCVNQRNIPECRPTPFKKPARASFPLEAPTVTNGDSACGAFTDIPVKVREGKQGRTTLRARAISTGKPRQGKDILFLTCQPRQDPCPTPVIIGFSGLAENGAPFTTYQEGGFTVSAGSGSWQVLATYGRPAPSVIFYHPEVAEILVTAGGSPFRFSSVDLYSSVTPIPYTITGLENLTRVFTVSGTVPNTFGNFETVLNPDATDLIDTLLITLSNPASCCSNPVGLDNIVLRH